jgi:stage III sporulation protein AF
VKYVISALNDWVKTIILVVLFASFLELLLPASSMQRFVRVIMGLLVMLTMLNPVVEFIQSRSTPQEIPALGGRIIAGPGPAQGGAAVSTGDKSKLAVELYKKDLARQIRAVVLAMDGVADAQVAVQLKSDTDGGSAALEMIKITVRPGQSGVAQKIQPVSVAGGSEAKATGLSPQLTEKITRTVRELYQLRDSQVEIKPWN